MSKVILCTNKVAKRPFIFLNTKVEIYSYEELCFYILNNTVLISKSSLGEKLFDWIRDELGMTELYQNLINIVNKKSTAQEVLIAIISAGRYCEIEEIGDYINAWKQYRALGKNQRKKLKADAYLSYRRYVKALSIYDEIIESLEDDLKDINLLGNVYHNKAVALANNLDVEGAKEYFLKAYECNKNEESLRGYFIVYAAINTSIDVKQEMRRHDMDEEKFEAFMNEIGESNDDVREMTIYSMLQRAIYNRMNKDMIDYDKRMEIILTKIKDDFREQAI